VFDERNFHRYTFLSAGEPSGGQGTCAPALPAFGTLLTRLALGEFTAYLIWNIDIEGGHEFVYLATALRALDPVVLMKNQLFKGVATFGARIFIERHWKLLSA
jgi:hypothetical protein